MIQDILVALFLLMGVGFVLLAALGALRFQDALTRMAAVSKASTLGLTLIFCAVIIHTVTWAESFKAILTILLLWLSTPIASHLLGRAAVLTDENLLPQTQGKELLEEIKKNQ
ncbi:monovalent cation/H(+) antiporter subunit G [Pseudobdellovibrio exovorus]|uniref:Putative multisubunit Na+/H+ antiporter n=1 Tax=Pseudobdellovibrio exovorus JSS TaxID=1184267 RepID=M4V4X6_9BACT|nr:monovalent cation/H(+) antiporter subunit G [Pseudobdellovibrio exovorus]AGH94392.1 putative multisubunit Na+/H+ antiporter [Pseudobdellovibrio exovorus JSS]